MDEVVGADPASLRVALVPVLCLQDLRLIHERAVVAEHAFIGRERLWRCARSAHGGGATESRLA